MAAQSSDVILKRRHFAQRFAALMAARATAVEDIEAEMATIDFSSEVIAFSRTDIYFSNEG